MQAALHHPEDITATILHEGYPILTRAECDVLNWLIRGKTDSEIAVIIDCASGTVSKHVTHILRKLSVENRHAATWAVVHAICFGPRPLTRQ